MFQKFVNYLKKRLFYIWLLLFSFASILISPEPSLHYAILGVFIFYYLIYAYNQKLFSFVVLFITITLSLYYPVSQYYGSLNSGIVAAFLETNISESMEFIHKIDFSQLLFPIFYILSAIILIRLKKYNQRSAFDNKKRIMYIILLGVFGFALLYAPTKFYLETRLKEEGDEAKWTLSHSPINIISFYVNIYESIRDYYIEKEELALASHVTPPWKVQSFSPKYQNYVLIIGESARRDYLSTYGFPLPTTPFLDQTKGYINSGYISAAPATYHSLLKSLYFKKEKKRDYSYNIITLAKAANVETNWLSNQGSIGKYDTIASRLGASADFFYFTKKGAFNTGNEDDFKLVEKFKERLMKTPSQNQARLFVLHLMGSHQDFCQRINEEEKKLEFINKKMSCYVNSILKTDRLISEVITLLKEKNESYSLIYFSDHGLNHIEKEEKEKLNLDYDSKFKSNYEVPFVKISSDDLTREKVNTKRSAFNFIYGFSQWLNIVTAELNTGYAFFSSKDDENIEVFNFDNNIHFNELESDSVSEIIDKK